ncbi:sprT-like domain-containing protein Spartan isoform X2 [Seriola lalandi dorsalis]|uniref:sprT-like domain-containing protein Spartan isoform X2 n=1 Tax=Seriola lalandi dorsalis TaxID=1841481 RepID=UPI000C6FA970|nr:sprT-like domain-containing protein Spartan isoform X2 [Seriola lalandi dorsalis]
MDEDFLLAIQLQEQFDSEYETSLFPSDCFEDNGFGQSSKKRKVDAAPGGGSDVVPYFKPAAQPERPLSIVDESWEILDPSPDVRAMFLEFNDMFFWGKLSGVEVKWSPRMTLCAGVCSYEGRGGLCSIRLSEPLLKLRPRKDLVQTLLHEMIHALLFVTQNNRDRDGHGPEFCKHMNRINKATGTNITIYHSFHDEVDVYRQHWWRCNGPCQNRKPYFGYVKRAMNRAPSSLDPWWEDHRRTCGGAYTKIKEPEGYGKKGKKDGKTSDKKASGNGKASSTTTTTGSGSQDIRNIIPFSGKGFVLGVKSQSSTSSSPSHKPPVPAVKSPTSSPVSPPKKLPTPSSPAKSLTSPVRSGPDKTGISAAFRSIRPAASTGQKPPVKRSVSNTRVFVNIGGSPVRIPKPHSGSSSLGAEKIKQRSIEDLFNSIGVRKSVGHSPSNTETKRDSWTSPKSTTSAASASSSFPKQQSSSSASTSKPSPSKSSQGSPAKPLQSKYLNHSNSDSTLGAAGGGQTSRKRPWDDRNSSASIFDFFQKTLGSDSAAASRESTKTKTPAMQHRTATTTTTTSSSSSSSSTTSSLPSSAALHSVTSTSTSTSSSSSSSSALMVSCPVCQAKVQESKINQHLDSCLS